MTGLCSAWDLVNGSPANSSLGPEGFVKTHNQVCRPSPLPCLRKVRSGIEWLPETYLCRVASGRKSKSMRKQGNLATHGSVTGYYPQAYRHKIRSVLLPKGSPRCIAAAKVCQPFGTVQHRTWMYSTRLPRPMTIYKFDDRSASPLSLIRRNQLHHYLLRATVNPDVTESKFKNKVEVAMDEFFDVPVFRAQRNILCFRTLESVLHAQRLL